VGGQPEASDKMLGVPSRPARSPFPFQIS